MLLDNGVGAESLQHIPRKWKRDAVRVLLDLGMPTTPNQALQLLHEWREQRDGEVRDFIASEFRSYVKRREWFARPRPRPRACDTSREWPVSSR